MVMCCPYRLCIDVLRIGLARVSVPVWAILLSIHVFLSCGRLFGVVADALACGMGHIALQGLYQCSHALLTYNSCDARLADSMPCPLLHTSRIDNHQSQGVALLWLSMLRIVCNFDNRSNYLSSLSAWG